MRAIINWFVSVYKRAPISQILGRIEIDFMCALVWPGAVGRLACAVCHTGGRIAASPHRRIAASSA